MLERNHRLRQARSVFVDQADQLSKTGSHTTIIHQHFSITATALLAMDVSHRSATMLTVARRARHVRQNGPGALSRICQIGYKLLLFVTD